MNVSRSEDFDVMLSFIESIPPDYFDEFRALRDEFDLDVEEEPRENEPFAALEWFVPTVIVVYVGMKFIDAFLKRAVDDFADATYPKVKAALVALSKRCLISDRSRFSVISSGRHKVTNPHSHIFSVVVRGRLGMPLKFVFHQELSAVQLELAIAALFVAIEDDYDATTQLSSDATNSADVPSYQVTLLYSVSSQQWEVVDPRQLLADRQRAAESSMSRINGVATGEEPHDLDGGGAVDAPTVGSETQVERCE